MNGGGMEENDMVLGGANSLRILRHGPHGLGMVIRKEWYSCSTFLSTRRKRNWGDVGTARKYERLVMRPDSKFAFFIYSNKDRVEQRLSIHQRVPITLRGRILRMERAENRPYGLPPGSLGNDLEQGKPADPATCSAILEELTRTV